MTANENFSQLTDQVNEAQAKVKAAAGQSRAELQAQVELAQASAEQQAGEMKAQAAQDKTEAAAGWQAMKDKWHSHVTDLRQQADEPDHRPPCKQPPA
jgi:hypothetical protein